jgi:hypothetical protein
MWQALLAGGIGAIAGGQKDVEQGNTDQSSVTSMQLQDINKLNKGRSRLEAMADNETYDSFRNLQGLIDAGPGKREVQEGLQGQKDLASLIQGILANNGMASNEQIGASQKYAQSMFNPQRVALQQRFEDEDVASQRLAGRLGRAGNDPILRNKLAQEKTRQFSQLEANQGAFAAETAFNMPQMQLNYANQLATVRDNLASQAFANRTALMQMGQALQQSERNYRMGTATKTTNTSQSTYGSSGGGAKGAISGGMAAFGQGMKGFR